MSKGNDTQTVRQTSDPWSGVAPYLKGAYGEAAKQYAKGAPGYYPGQTVAQPSGYTMGALDSMAARGAAGSDVTRAAQGQLQKTLGGDYLSGETPGFQGAMNAAIRPVIDNYTKTVMPGIDSNFSSAGRYGSGAHGLAEGDAYGQMQNTIGDISSQMAYQNYGDERNRQIQGMLFAPDLAAQDYQDINALGQAGQGIDTINQNNINADMAKYNFNQNKDFNFLNQYLAMLNGAQGGSQTTTQPVQQANPFTGALGGAMAGGSMFGPIGALGGGTLGLLGSLFA